MSEILIKIKVSEQLLILCKGNHVLGKHLISTAFNGVGQVNGSEQTPLGWHIIRAKIGAGLPLNTVFVSRRPTGEIYTPELAANSDRRDWILTRILWLSGLEVGKNRRGQVDTMRRYIYIHGTPDHVLMGKPGSRGCVRMHNGPLVELFNQVSVGTKVEIKE